MKTSRSEAIKRGDRYYMTNKKCKHGHSSRRVTADGSCWECRMVKQRNNRKEMRKDASCSVSLQGEE